MDADARWKASPARCKFGKTGPVEGGCSRGNAQLGSRRVCGGTQRVERKPCEYAGARSEAEALVVGTFNVRTLAFNAYSYWTILMWYGIKNHGLRLNILNKLCNLNKLRDLASFNLFQKAPFRIASYFTLSVPCTYIG